MRKYQTPLACFFFALCLLCYGLQLRSLYIYPVVDSVQWGGDETWLMREFGNQAAHGAMQYPEHFGAPDRTDGVLAGSMWVDAALYGIAGHLFFPTYDYVSIGRTVTAILGLILLILFAWIGRRLGLSYLLLSCSLLLLVTSQAFLWATHSARYDVLTGITLLAYLFLLSQNTAEISRSKWLLIGIASVMMIIFSRHMLTLSIPATALFLYQRRIWKEWQSGLAYLSGVIFAALVLCGAYWLGAGEFSLFGRGGSLGSYGFVLNQIPILRPFSRNVQVSNLIERLHLFWFSARGVLYLIIVVILLVLVYELYQLILRNAGKVLRISTTPEQRFIFGATAPCGVSWLLLQGSRPYYLLHLLPLLIFSGAIAYQWLTDVLRSYRYGSYAGSALMLAGLVFQINQSIPKTEFAQFVATDQKRTITRMMHDIDSSAGHGHKVLVDVAGLNVALRDTSQVVQTLDMFQPPPDSSAVLRKLHDNNIEYVMLRSSPVSAPFEPGRALLPIVLAQHSTVQKVAAGFFYDDGRRYGAGLETLLRQGLDTLKLYHLK